MVSVCIDVPVLTRRQESLMRDRQCWNVVLQLLLIIVVIVLNVISPSLVQQRAVMLRLCK